MSAGAAGREPEVDEASVRANEHYQAGLAAVEAQNNDDALAHFTRALFLVPDEPVLYVARAEAYVRLCDLKSAASNYKKALSLQPQPDPSFRNRLAAVLDALGLLALSQGKAERSVAYFDDALGNTPGNKVVALHRCLAHFVLGKHEQALKDITLCEGTDLCQPWAYIAEATMHLLRGSFTLSKGCIEKAMLIAPDSQQVAALEKLFYAEFDRYKAKAIEAMEEERWPDAVPVLNHCITTFPHDPELYKMRSHCNTAMRKYTAAVQDLFESINKSGSANAEAASQLSHTLVLIADELTSKGDYHNAISYCDEALRWDSRMSAAYIRRADCSKELGSHEKALADYRRVLEIDPEDAEGRWKLALLHNEWGTVLYNDGKFGLAEHEFSRAIGHESRTVAFHYNRAKCLLMLQQPSAAIRELAVCRDLGPTDSEMWKMINQFCPPGSGELNATPRSPQPPVRSPKHAPRAAQRSAAVAAVRAVERRDPRSGLVLRPVRYTPPVKGSTASVTPVVEQKAGARPQVLGNDEVAKKLAPITGFESYTNFKSGDSKEMYSLRREKSILQDPYGVVAVRDVAQAVMQPDKSHSARRFGRWASSVRRCAATQRKGPLPPTSVPRGQIREVLQGPLPALAPSK